MLTVYCARCHKVFQTGHYAPGAMCPACQAAADEADRQRYLGKAAIWTRMDRDGRGGPVQVTINGIVGAWFLVTDPGGIQRRVRRHNVRLA